VQQKISFDHALKLANKKHDVVALQVFDERESELPDVGMRRFRHAKTCEAILIDTANPQVRTNYKKNWDVRQRQLADSFARSGVDRAILRSDQSYVQPLMKLFTKRGRK